MLFSIAGLVHGAYLAHHPAGHLGIAVNAVQFLKAFDLDFAGADDASDNIFAGFRRRALVG